TCLEEQTPLTLPTCLEEQTAVYRSNVPGGTNRRLLFQRAWGNKPPLTVPACLGGTNHRLPLQPAWGNKPPLTVPTSLGEQTAAQRSKGITSLFVNKRVPAAINNDRHINLKFLYVYKISNAT
ncbi:hypothetical protein, partial [Lelliottia amnigena]|uniref:hypothetical protein n=1 Tax=Lelliottia amnigena TaxID=61646 RepID=UPI00197E5C94